MGSNGNNDRLYFLGPQKQIVTAATKLKDVLSLEKRTMTKLVKSESHLVVSDSLQSNGTIQSMNSLGPNTGVGSLSLSQGIFPTQGSNPGLPHCRQILYQLSHKNTGVGSLSLLQGIFPTQGLNPGLPHCRQILYQLSHKGSLHLVCFKTTLVFPAF